MDRSPPDSWPRTLAVVALFVAVGSLGLLHHEMWRDELEIWLIARDSASLPELFVNMGTEGHPALWYLLVFALTRLTGQPVAMQLLNLIAGAGAVLIFYRHAPFGRIQRLLFCFGYYALYEFTVISRSYAIQLLLTCALCVLLSRSRRVGWAAATLLFLLANTNFYGIVIAGQLILLALLEALRRRRPGRAPLDLPGAAALAFASSGLAIGFTHSLVQALSIGPDHLGTYQPALDLRWLLEGLGTIGRGLLALPDPGNFHTWNSTLLDALPGLAGPLLGALLGSGFLILGVASLRRDRPLLAVFLLGAAAMLGFLLFVWFGYQRHHGQVFLWFLACFWLLREPRAAPSGATRVVLTVLLATQVLSCAWALARDWVHPFSNAGAAGAYLSAETGEDGLLVGSIDYAVQPIAAFVERPVYYPESDRFGTFMDWSTRRRMVPVERAVEAALELVEERGGEVMLILTYTPRGTIGETWRLEGGVEMTFEARFDGALVANENYCIYRLARARPGS